MGTGRDAFREAAACSMALEWSYLSSFYSINMPLRSIREMPTVLAYKLLPLTVKYFRPYLGILLTDSSSLTYIFLQFNFHIGFKNTKEMFWMFFPNVKGFLVCVW